MKKVAITLAIAALFLTACSSKTPAPTTATTPVPTEEAAPVAVPTARELANDACSLLAIAHTANPPFYQSAVAAFRALPIENADFARYATGLESPKTHALDYADVLTFCGIATGS